MTRVPTSDKLFKITSVSEREIKPRELTQSIESPTVVARLAL
jgi:hypothetical protein